MQHETCCMLLIEWLSGLWGVSKLFLGPKMGRSKKKNSGLTAKPTTQPSPTPGPAFRSWIPLVSQVKKLSINLIRKKTRADFDAFKSTAFKGTEPGFLNLWLLRFFLLSFGIFWHFSVVFRLLQGENDVVTKWQTWHWFPYHVNEIQWDTQFNNSSNAQAQISATLARLSYLPLPFLNSPVLPHSFIFLHTPFPRSSVRCPTFPVQMKTGTKSLTTARTPQKMA